MKGGLAVLLDLATTVPAPAVDVTYVFYACEEVARRHNALARLAAHAPRPPRRRRRGARRAHGRRGRGRVPGHDAGRGLGRRAGAPTRPGPGWGSTPCTAWRRSSPRSGRYEPRRVVLDGCEYTEQLQAVGIEGGVAGNVVPDRATVTINYRFAPDRDVAAAEADAARPGGRRSRPRGG